MLTARRTRRQVRPALDGELARRPGDLQQAPHDRADVAQHDVGTALLGSAAGRRRLRKPGRVHERHAAEIEITSRWSLPRWRSAASRIGPPAMSTSPETTIAPSSAVSTDKKSLVFGSVNWIALLVPHTKRARSRPLLHRERAAVGLPNCTRRETNSFLRNPAVSQRRRMGTASWHVDQPHRAQSADATHRADAHRYAASDAAVARSSGRADADAAAGRPHPHVIYVIPPSDCASRRPGRRCERRSPRSVRPPLPTTRHWHRPHRKTRRQP